MVGMSRQARKSLGKQGNQSASMEISRQAEKSINWKFGRAAGTLFMRLLLCFGLELEVREGGRHPKVYLAVPHPRLGFEPRAFMRHGLTGSFVFAVALWPHAFFFDAAKIKHATKSSTRKSSTRKCSTRKSSTTKSSTTKILHNRQRERERERERGRGSANSFDSDISQRSLVSI
jgi:hypothetical protein